ncbi:hypothetical protein HDU81_003710 [Chytriomyces hyalinus]|nr:hypothetical protein HDU81_003710 [Chytriomyces hyalinus]
MARPSSSESASVEKPVFSFYPAAHETACAFYPTPQEAATHTFARESIDYSFTLNNPDFIDWNFGQMESSIESFGASGATESLFIDQLEEAPGPSDSELCKLLFAAVDDIDVAMQSYSTETLNVEATTPFAMDQTQSPEQAITTTQPSQRTPKKGSSNLQCETCGKQFNRRYNLNTHEKTHLLNRPRDFTCLECGKQFIRIHDLERHNVTHDVNQWKQCGRRGCPKKFARTDALKRHQRKCQLLTD